MVRLWILLLLATLLATKATAHEVDTCLARLAQTAGLLKNCRIGQTREDECTALDERLQRNRQTCRDEAYPEEAIRRAAGYGAAEVAGDTAQSPYQQTVRQQAREQSRMQPNLLRFNQHFPGYGHFADDLAARFNSRLCPDAYEGSRDRWLYTGSVTLLRYAVDAPAGDPPQRHDKRLFAQGKPGECYPVATQLEPTAPFLVVNIPETLLSQLEQKTGVVKCESATCATDRMGVESLYQHYQAEYRRYRQLLDCVDIDRRNRQHGSKGMTAARAPLPVYCPSRELDVALLNSRGLVQELDQRLFSRITRPLGHGKTQ